MNPTHAKNQPITSSSGTNELITTTFVDDLQKQLESVRGPLISNNLSVYNKSSTKQPEDKVTAKQSLSQSLGWAKFTGRGILTEQFLLRVCAQTIPLATAWLGAKLVPLAISVHSTGAGFSNLVGSLSGLAAFGIVSSCINARLTYVNNAVSNRTFHVLHREIMETGAALSSQLLEQASVQNKIVKLRENIGFLKDNVNAVVEGLSNVVVLAITAAAVGILSPPIAGMIVLLGTWKVLQARQSGKEKSLTEDLIAEPRRQMWYASWPVRDPEGLQSVKHLLKSGQVINQMIETLKSLDRVFLYIQGRDVKRSLANELAVLTTVTIASTYGIFSYISGAMPLDSALYLAAAAGVFSLKMNGFSTTIGNWVSSKPFVDEAVALLRLSNATREREREMPAKDITRYNQPPGIVIKDAAVSIPQNITDVVSTRRIIIKGINLTIRPGEFVGIVGRTGAGKTTLIKMLLGTMEASSGAAMFDNKPIQTLPLAELRANTSYLPQVFWNYQGRSVEYNISIGNPVWEPARDISDAILNSGLANVMKANGFDRSTVIGPEFKNGRNFSGGEWQLIALARSLAKDGKLIILDEPTSRLDVDTAKAVTTHIRDMTGHTRILITHDIGLAKYCDRIVVLAKENQDDETSPGIIEAVGTHEELMESSPTYQRFYTTQAQRFDKE